MIISKKDLEAQRAAYIAIKDNAASLASRSANTTSTAALQHLVTSTEAALEALEIAIRMVEDAEASVG